jgi:RDD family
VRENGSPLDDFPLHGGARGHSFVVPIAPGTAQPHAVAAAPIAARWSAAAADAAAVLLIGALAILAARLATGASPRLSGIAWALGFLVYLSLFATVPPLILFGKTVGMALAELSVRRDAGGSGLSAAAALRRWLGTLATAAGAGLPLLWTARSSQAPTLADRLSGHPLAVD